jgi:2-oxoglutarate ferredoxin oxidoreductase subunit gamma
MRHDIIIAGFGGQGIMLAGQVLATAGMLEGQNVVWSPSYGPEMRGGPAHCTVIVSPEPIGSPVVSQADAVLILDDPSLAKFEPKARPGGLLIINDCLVRTEPSRDDLRLHRIAANARAEEAGDVRTANMVMLGALQTLLAPVRRESLSKAFRTLCPADRTHLIPLNEAALQMGMADAALEDRAEAAAPCAACQARAGSATRRAR